MSTDRLVYELWDTDTNNAIASFETPGEAALFVRHLVAEQSADYLNPLVLIEVNQFGHGKNLATGRDELVRFQARGGAVTA